ncbi:MAG: hypothetical protein WAM71_07065 [Candidatus Korobacteraceae bacterium]
MTQTIYTLSWILPFVRQSLKATTNFEYRSFVQQLWTELEKAQVPGIGRTPLLQMQSGQVFQYDQAPHELRVLTTEAFFYLFHNGFITPAPPDRYLNHPNFHTYCVTQRGMEWFKGGEPLPEDVAGYMKFLRERVSNMDAVIEQYVIEALTAFERQAHFAAAVMLGAASEKALYLLAESVLGAFRDGKRHDKLKALLDRRKLLELFEYVRDTISDTSKAKALPYSDSEGAATQLMSLYDAIRVQRNDAVHPMNATVSADSVRLLIQSFPYALSKSEELRAWFASNPKSI